LVSYTYDMTENGARFVFGKRTTYINEIEEMQYMTKHEVVATQVYCTSYYWNLMISILLICELITTLNF
jgi:hypothetical protein